MVIKTIKFQEASSCTCILTPRLRTCGVVDLKLPNMTTASNSFRNKLFAQTNIRFPLHTTQRQRQTQLKKKRIGADSDRPLTFHKLDTEDRKGTHGSTIPRFLTHHFNYLGFVPRMRLTLSIALYLVHCLNY